MNEGDAMQSSPGPVLWIGTQFCCKFLFPRSQCLQQQSIPCGFGVFAEQSGARVSQLLDGSLQRKFSNSLSRCRRNDELGGGVAKFANPVFIKRGGGRVRGYTAIPV